jgi:hypothetical protein
VIPAISDENFRSRLLYGQSIRLTNWDAEELSKMLKAGVPAILQEE